MRALRLLTLPDRCPRRGDMRSIALPLFLVLMLSACGGGGSGDDADAGAAGGATVAKTLAEDSGTNCPNGGSRIDTGIDLDADGVLDDDEVTKTHYACNGRNA